NGDFIESSEINLPANEVENRILINADNTGGNVWEEDAVITVRATVMDVPDYAATPSRVGEGTIAEIPYRRHAAWSTPIEGGHVPIRRIEPPSMLEPPACEELSPAITIRTYGFVRHDGSGAPLKIEHRVVNAMGNVSWDDVTADF